jgi:hypothetical protein
LRRSEQVLAEKGYSVLTQDYDIPLASSFIEKMHEGVIEKKLPLLVGLSPVSSASTPDAS